MLAEYADALFDFAFSVTGDTAAAVAAVRGAVPEAVAAHGPEVDRATLYGATLAVAVRDARPPEPLAASLIEPGGGEPDDLARLTRTAGFLLDPAHRGCLDLTLRQGLEGEELSAALGVTPGLASITVQAATEQAEHVIGAVLLARLGRLDCAGLADVAIEAVGLPPEKLAAGVVEHQASCPSCEDRRRALVPVTTLLAASPPVAPPEGLTRPMAPPPASSRRGVGRPPDGRWLVAAAVTVAVVGAGTALLWPEHGRQIRSLSVAGGRLTADVIPVDFGVTANEGRFQVTNSGREPLVFEARPTVPWIVLTGGEGRLEPGTGADVSATLDRSRAPEGAAGGEIRVHSDGGSAVIPVRVVVERNPELSAVEATPGSLVIRRCPGSTPAQVRVSVVEESGLSRVDLHWVAPGAAEQVSPMTGEKPSFMAQLGPFDRPGHVRWWVSALDIRNNQAASPPQVLRVGSC